MSPKANQQNPNGLGGVWLSVRTFFTTKFSAFKRLFETSNNQNLQGQQNQNTNPDPKITVSLDGPCPPINTGSDVELVIYGAQQGQERLGSEVSPPAEREALRLLKMLENSDPNPSPKLVA